MGQLVGKWPLPAVPRSDTALGEERKYLSTSKEKKNFLLSKKLYGVGPVDNIPSID